MSVADLKQRIAERNIRQPKLGDDISAGIVSAIVGIPQGMAYALLAGVNPIYGLYTAIVATTVAGLTTNSVFMNVSLTNTLALAVGSALADFSGSVRVERLFTLTLLVGLIQLGFGLARLGDLTRFVSNGVMTGFIAGSAVLIIAGQVNDLTGVTESSSGDLVRWLSDSIPALDGNKIIAALSTLAHPAQLNPLVTLIGIGTILLVIILGRTPLKTFAMILALAITSLIANLVNLNSNVVPIELVSDVSEIPAGLPALHVPALLEGGFIMFYSAIPVAVLSMVQSASVSQSVPNPNGDSPRVSRDFRGIGLASIASSFFQGFPGSGSFSGTSLNISSGARSRFANVFAGIFTALIVLLLGGVVERIAMSAIAGVLIVIGVMALPLAQIRRVWRTNWNSRITMLVTFIATLSIPVQNAIYLGIVLSLGLFVYTSSRQIRVVRVVRTEDGHFDEQPAPRLLPDNEVVLLNIYGNLYFGAVSTLEKLLPSAQGSNRSVVILRLRGRESLGSTVTHLLERYAKQLRGSGGKLMLAGVDPELRRELVETGVINVIGAENVFDANSILAMSSEHAVAVGRQWLDDDADRVPPADE